MRVIEAAVESQKVQVLQQDTWETTAKTYSFPVDTHLSQLTIQVTNYKTNDSIKVGIRDPEGKLITKEDGLRQLMKTVPNVFVASIDHPTPGTWTLEVSAEVSGQPSVSGEENLGGQWHSVRVSGISEIDFVPGFAANQLPYNLGASRQPIAGIKNYLMTNITGRLMTGSVDAITLRAPNGTALVRLPVERTPGSQVYVSQHAMDPVPGHYYLQVTGRDSQGYTFQRYSKVALLARAARPSVVTCPAKLEVARGATAQIACLVDSEVPFSVKWYQNNRPLINFPGEHQIFSVPTNVTYTLHDANEESQGIYAVVMVPTGIGVETRPEGQGRDEVAVVILPPPPTVFIPRNASVEPNGLAHLMCTVFSQADKVDINWYRGDSVRFKVKDGRRHSIRMLGGGETSPDGQTFTSTLQISNVQDSDIGQYICEAEHKGGVSSAVGFVVIHVRPSVMAESSQVDFKDGGRLVLSCRVEGHPPPEISWSFNDVPIPRGENMQIGSSRINILDEYMESRLIISPADASDAGRYSCFAVNSAGEAQADIIASFIARPEITRIDMAREMPQEGERQTLRCLASGQPPPLIKWEFNGSPVGESTNIRLNQTTGELEILHLKRHMSGKWTCVAENVAGSTRTSVSMEVGHKPKMDTGAMQERIFGDFASDLVIPCIVDGNPPPQIKWFKLVGESQVPVAYGSRYTLAADNSLHITDLNLEDSTTFVCEASNTYGRDQYHVSVELGGIRAPTISYTEPRQVVLEGISEMILNCPVLDAKPAAQVTWLKNSVEINLSDPRYALLDTSLVIRAIEMGDEGIYTCVAHNVVGRSKIDIELDVQTKPRFIDDTRLTTVEITQGKVMELHCEVEGDPKPEVEWRKDGRLVTPKRGSSSGAGGFILSPDGYVLTVYSVTDATSGIFTCSAINTHGAVSKEFQVTVRTPPSISKEGVGEVEIAQNEMTLLTCMISYGHPQPTIRWFKNGQPLVEIPGRVHIVDNGQSVEIRGEREEESGSYECRAENEVGFDSRFYQVAVLVPPTYTSTHVRRRLLVRTGERVDLECGMSGFPEPEIFWSWNGRPLEANKLDDLGVSIRPPREGTSQLTIMYMNGDLQGNYTCIGRNRGGTTSMDYEVILLTEPKIVDFGERAVVFLNNTITLTCGASGTPKPSISWWFEGSRIIPSMTPGYRIVGDGNLMIYNAQRHHGGDYTCIAENEAGQDSRVATITVFEPSAEPPISQNITTITMGGNITFTCKLTSNPPPKIKWYKDGVDIFSIMPQDRFTVSADESTLTIYDVQPEDQGQYKCEAENIPGNWDLSYYLEVTSSPGILVGSSSRLKEKVRQGQDLHLRCIAIGHPEPTYQWLKDDTPIASTSIPMGAGQSDKRVEISTVSKRYALHDQGRELVVFAAKPEDSGSYTCIATNVVGRDRHTMQVAVIAKPFFVDGLDHETPEVIRGESALLWCNASGFPQPKIKWSTHEGEVDQRNANIQIQSEGRALFIANVTQASASRYTCTATNDAGEARRIIDPVIVYAPVIISHEGENPRPVVRNGETQLSCDWDAYPDAKVEWFKGGEPINGYDFPRANFSIRNTMLYLHNVEAEDAGIYRCVVSNRFGSTKRQWNVLVMSPPRFLFTSEEGTQGVPLGGSVALFCVAEGEPKPMIKWTKDGAPITEAQGRFQISDDGVHLRLPAAEENDAGRYSCIASSPYGEVSKHFDIKVIYAPRLDGDGQRQYSIERTVGSSVILECLVIGNPTPSIEWYKDGSKLEPLPYRYRLLNQKRELEILSIQPVDAGRFRCVASNEVGSLEVSVDLTVGAPPRIDRGRLRSEYVVKEGDELVLPCPATGSPDPRLSFTRSELDPTTQTVVERPLGEQGTASDKDSLVRRAVVSQDRQALTIFRVQKSDAGTYQCNASNEIGWDTMKYTVRVRGEAISSLKIAVKIYRPPLNKAKKVVIAGDLIVLQCLHQVPPSFDTSNMQPEVQWFVNQTRFLDCPLHGFADPPPLLTWERHGISVVSGPAIQISADGSRLTVPRVSLSDAGDYKCIASNEVGRTSQTFHVLVHVRPRFVDPMRKINIEAIQNQTIYMSCEATGDPPPRVTWFKRDVELFPPGSFLTSSSTQDSHKTVMPLQGDQILQITNVQKSDAGDYACMASNGGEAIEKKFNLTVIMPPVILKPQGSPEVHSTREYVPETFHCLIRDYNSTQPEIVWTKDGSPILMSEDGDYFVVQDSGQVLTVVRPTSSESGTYRCEAKNKAGVDSHHFKLIVTAAPRFPTDFVRYREKLTQQIGSQVRLTCPVTGSPPPVVTWYYNGSPLLPYTVPSHYSFDMDNRVLNFISGQKDSGEYRCIAHNEAGNISKTYELEIIMPPLVRLDRAEMREREGSTFTVQCIAEGHPPPKIEWTRSTGGLFRIGTNVDLATGILTITDARKEDTGVYTCTATNKISSDSKTVDIQVIERPLIQTTTAPVVVNEGDQVVLPCTVTGTPPIQVHWRLPSGQQITQDEILGFQVLPQQGLLIESATRTHAGLYRCSASNEAGSQNAVISLEVLVPPKLVRPATIEASGKMNSVLQLNCEVEEGIPKPIVIWERNGVSFSRTKSFYTTTDSGLFIFNALKPQDEGEWICVARNPAGEDRLAFNVIVSTPPRVSMSLSSVGYEGQSITLDCQVEGKPIPEVVWEFKNEPVGMTFGSRARLDSPTRLTIHNLQPEDAGNYFCIASIPGQDRVMDSTYLTVFTIPTFVSTPNRTIDAFEDRWIQFRCTADGHPKPEIKWTFRGNMIGSNPSHNGIGSLIIGPLRESHSGQYACIATNDAGKKEHTFQFTVKTRPKVHMYQSDEAIRTNEMARLYCNVSGDADSIVWLKDGIPIKSDQRVNIENDGSSLVISMARSVDNGVYQCIAANPVGEDLGELRLVIESKPQLVKTPANSTASLGEIITLECQAEGHPTPIISWYHNNVTVRMSSTHSIIRNGSLRIVGVSEKDEGIYHCVASSYQGEVISDPATIQVQIPGGWSEWMPWQPCSATCGRGVQMRGRLCESPAPRNGGAYCVGENAETRACLQAFCPVDGVWGSWGPWSACSSTCGAGLRHRSRKCDSPPPGNGGKPCPGEAMEDVLCEDLPLCPVKGGWSSWGPWSSCSRTCGAGSTQHRERKCDMPPPANGGLLCIGPESQVRACERKPCPINGSWGQWSAWSHCSKSCGGGIRRRTRQCNNPSPRFGGAPCQPQGGDSETTECQENPCPVNGEWSNWSSWSACVGRCGVGIQSRTRTCTEPAPSYGGHLCRGSAKDSRTCSLPFVDDSEPCPIASGSGGGVDANWSSWSAWSECVPDCSSTEGESGEGGRRHRTRNCMTLRDGKYVAAQSIRECEGHAEEVEKCYPPASGSLDCFDQNRPLFGNLIGELRGRLGGKSLAGIKIVGNWSAMSPKVTSFRIDFQNVPPEHSLCLQVLSEMASPVFWYAAREIERASNGEYVTGRSGEFTWNSLGQFADGSNVRLDLVLRRVNDEDYSSEQKFVVLRMETTIIGDCPIALRPDAVEDKDVPAWSAGAKVELSDFKEQIVQLDPSKGKLHASSSRTYGVVDWTSGRRLIEPYGWNSEVTTSSGRRQRFLSQNLIVDRLFVVSDPARGVISLSADTAISKVSGAVCPEGFEIVEARMDGKRQLLGAANLDYCRDVNECSSPNLNTCDHICENTSPGYSCKCHEGYRLSPDGRSCLDIDECMEGENAGILVCPTGQRCVNKPGTFNCVQGCGEGLQLSASGDLCEDIDECRSGKDVCSGHKCVNTYGGYVCSCRSGYELINNHCQDIDECKNGKARCRSNEACVNLPGWYECRQVCPRGYRFAGEMADGVPNCIDINECSTNENLCPAEAVCINEPGSFRCQCPDGQPPIKHSCLGAFGSAATSQNYSACQVELVSQDSPGILSRPDALRRKKELADKGELHFLDIDECNPAYGPGPCQYECHNTYGGYRCSCPLGYELNPLTNLCKDTNECKTSANTCKKGELCINTPGSHICIKPDCPESYQWDDKTQSCRVLCTESDLPCPKGARYADSVQYISVSIPRTNGTIGRNIMLRVVDWNQVQQGNCHYQLLDKASGTPVSHRSKNGVVYLIPDWTSPAFADPGSKVIHASLNQSAPALYYLFFRVSCYEGLPWYTTTNSQDFDVYPVGRQLQQVSYRDDSKLIFQHSFYVYISISNYPF
ncbi:Hemicentin-1 [Echinococcus granulosus]|uniref:Cell adhesion molecule-related/down-regulated by oncogenes n=1 Tax=Echinococcus granulosus TaxID=6210 RepID=W6UNT3_ECHGR|nr:Hemicentin-1 [Echinococcus granulosus]EUB62928.1 Hemicentin-1 [Echinococcus granulosus]